MLQANNLPQTSLEKDARNKKKEPGSQVLFAPLRNLGVHCDESLGNVCEDTNIGTGNGSQEPRSTVLC